MPPSSFPIGPKTLQYRNVTPTWAEFVPTWLHLSLISTAKIAILCGRGCFFSLFGDTRLKTSKLTSRWPPEPPKRPQERPKSPQGGPKTTPRGLKMAPRWPQDGSKTVPRRLQVAFKSPSKSTRCYLNFKISHDAPKMAPEPHQGAPRGPQGAPKRPQEAPRDTQEAPKRSP